MASAVPYFVGLAVIVVVGFFAAVLARRGHVPDLLLLILLGFLIGPMNAAYFGYGPLQRVIGEIPLASITPIFAAFALAVIMFDGGLNLPLNELATGLRRAASFTIVVFVATVAGIALAVHILLGIPLLLAIVLGAALGGISNAVVGSVLERLRISEKGRSLIALEAVLVDPLAIGVAIAAIEALRIGDLSGQLVARTVAATLAVGVVGGIVFGIAFAFSLPRMRGVPNLYILTIGLVIGLYGFIEYLGGSGPMGVLMMGVILGNSENPIFGGRDLAPELTAEIHHFHSQVAFLIRTFFFVLLGLTFAVNLDALWPAIHPRLPGLTGVGGAAVPLALAVIAVYAVIVGTRAFAARAMAPEPSDRGPIVLVVGRGLGSAVLATYPFTLPEYADPTSPYSIAVFPYRDIVPTLASILIVMTVLTTAGGLWVHSRGPGRSVPDPRAPP